MHRVGAVAFVLFVLTVVAANWAVNKWGLVHMLGFLVPAGVLFAGVAFLLRDLVQRGLGRHWALLAIALGSGVSAIVSPRLAAASALAFLCSELADMAVFTYFERRFVPAVVGSNVVGAAIDSLMFLWLAGFLTAETFKGQFVLKCLVTVAALPFLYLSRRKLAVA